MSGLDPASIDLAISSKSQIANVLKDFLPDNRFTIQIGTTALVPTFNVNPTLGNNFQMGWDSVLHQLTIHNDFPIYSGGDYYYIDVINPATDKVIPIANLPSDLAPYTPYNHIFLVVPVSPTPHIGNIEIVATATTEEPDPIAVKLLYIGWVYEGDANKIIVRNIGRLIDLSFATNYISYLDYLDDNTKAKVTQAATNILRFTGFFGPGMVKTICELGLFMTDDVSLSHMLAYAKISPFYMSASENVRIIWNIVI
jgi:hypothetical protein